MKNFALAILYLVMTIPLKAAMLTVDDDGSAGFNNIQDAIDAADNGDQIVIEDGTYAGQGNRDIDFKGKAITVRSKNGPENCIIDCQAAPRDYYRGFILNNNEDKKSVISGLTIINGYSFLGGAIYCNGASPTISNCLFINNKARHHGGAIYCDSSTAKISNCIFDDNSSVTGHGGAIFSVRSELNISKCKMNSNKAGSCGGGIFNNKSSPVLNDCEFNNNSADDFGGAISSINQSISTENNCKFEKNRAKGSSKDSHSEEEYPVSSLDTKTTLNLPNEIALNSASNTYYVNGNCGDDSWSGIQGVCGGPDGPKLTIQSAIDTSVSGDTVVVMPAIYYENITVLNKDIAITSIDPDSSIITESTIIDGGGGNTVITMTNSDVSIFGITVQNGGGSSGGGILCDNSNALIVKSEIKNNNASNRGGGICGYPENNLTLTSCNILSNSIYPDGNGGGLAGGDTASSITECTFAGNEVYMGDGGAIASFDGLIKNCYIIDNHITWEALYDGGGGLAYCTGPIINCIISNNSVEFGDGGGMSECSGPITNCIITDNLAWSGYGDVVPVSGGGLAGCNGSITNCLIAGNVAHNTDSSDQGVQSKGGGIANCNGTITNCTIVNNLAVENIYGSYAGGLWNCNGTISNSIVWGNTALTDPQIYSSSNPNYSCIQDWTGGGVGNISTAPLFVDPNNGDYHLKSQYGRWNAVKQLWVYDAVTSPCIDVGDPISDWTSELWPHGKRINIGAHGGTPQASMSSSATGNIANANNDDRVNLQDFVMLSMQWCHGQARTIPRGTISVDADMSDWDDHIEWIPLDKNYNGDPSDISEAKFALRWNNQTNKIYAAVVVDDSDHIITDDYINWDASDRLEVFSQGDAAGGTGWWHWTDPTWDAAQQYMIAPDTVGGSWATWGNGWEIDPSFGLEYAVRVDGNKIIYEVGIPQFDNYGEISGGQTIPSDLRVGHVVGFDIIADTRHSTGFGMLSENMMIEKFKDADSFAHYILSDTIASPPYEPLSCDLDRNQVVDIWDAIVMADNWLYQE